VAAFFRGADAVALPYHRSSASGPLHIAMSEGLPVIVTSVGGLVEAAGPYEGVRFVKPQRPDEIVKALREVAELRGRRFDDPHSWERSIDALEALVESLGR
jgi:glycosyltransferase involved in cell wall biosynthesis